MKLISMMSTKPRRVFRFSQILALSCALLLGGALSLAPVDYAQAQSKEEKEKNLKYKNRSTRQTGTVGAACAKRLTPVQDLTDAGRWAEAEKALRNALAGSCKSSFEKAQAWRYLGYVLYSRDNIRGAIDAYRNVIKEPKAGPKMKTDTRYSLAQLLFVTEDYKGAVRELEQWVNEASIVDTKGRALLAQGYYQIGRKKDALRVISEIVRETEAEGKVPKENWLSLQWVLYYETNQYKSAVSVSRKLLNNYTKVKYWRQLSALYANLEEETKQMLTLELVEMQGDLKQEKQLLSLAYQYMAFDIPYRGAMLIEKGMKDGTIAKTEKNLETLGQAYQRAREDEKAASVLEQAAAKSSDGSIWARLSNVYLNLDQNKKAAVAAKKALQKGGLKRTDLMWMNLGTAQANLHCYNDAEKSFNKAAGFEDSKKNAENWRTYVRSEGDRRSALIKAGAKLATCQRV